MNKTQETYTNEEDYLARHYSFKPSISKRRALNGKSYIIRSYFAGGNDIQEAVTQLAVKQAYKDGGKL